MVSPMRSKALLSKNSVLKTGNRSADSLPMRIADLDDCELLAHCDCCGRHLRLYPGHAGFDARMRLSSLFARLSCTGRRNGDACGGLPRRLVLLRNERRWVLEASTGQWTEDDYAFWEDADFDMVVERFEHRAAA